MNETQEKLIRTRHNPKRQTRRRIKCRDVTFALTRHTHTGAQMGWCDDTSPTVASEHETLERKVYNSYEHIAFTKLIAGICESRDIASKKKKKKRKSSGARSMRFGGKSNVLFIVPCYKRIRCANSISRVQEVKVGPGESFKSLSCNFLLLPHTSVLLALEVCLNLVWSCVSCPVRLLYSHPPLRCRTTVPRWLRCSDWNLYQETNYLPIHSH